ncbi:hypothetical protein EXN66_Car003714 [Channa argus]|uniref:Uncharacterized protein n=1 Tax=Channa argus TaxID=215402 RepID=A0A6G1PCS3_CHAAH|nr:hypothetical protein EXN66_Car003714 [Channa argus]
MGVEGMLLISGFQASLPAQFPQMSESFSVINLHCGYCRQEWTECLFANTTPVLTLWTTL